MSSNKNGFSNVTGMNGEEIQPIQFDVDAGTAATIKLGHLVIFAASNQQYVLEATDGLDSDGLVCGIAASDSTETASVDGTVLVYRAPALKATIEATTPGNLAATTKLNLVTLDVTGTVHTVDENDTTKGFIRILTYDNTTDGNCEVEVPCRYVLWT